MDIKYNKFVLDNGIRIVYLPREDNNITSISVFCNVGSINETKSLEGASHFLEHMLFKGTKKRPGAKLISKELDTVGAYFNAYTDKDVTSYIVKVNSDYIEKGLDILSDMLLNSHFNKDDFEMEKKVVVEEINRSKDNPSDKIMENMYEILYKNNPLEHSIGSEEETILNYDRDEVIGYFKKYYNSNNIVISIASNIKFNKILELVKNSEFSNYTKQEDIPDPNKDLEIQTSPRYYIQKKDLEQVHLVLGFPTEGRFNEDRYTLDLIKILLAGNMSSRLFIDLRETHGLSYNVSVDLSYYKYCGNFCIQTSFDKDSLFIKNEFKVTDKYELETIFKGEGKNEKDIGPGGLPIILENIKKLKNKLVSIEELERVKGFLKGHLIIETENSHSISDYFGRQIIYNHDPILNFKYILDKYETITPENIKTISDKYLDFNKLNIAVTGDYKESDIRTFINEYCFK